MECRGRLVHDWPYRTAFVAAIRRAERPRLWELLLPHGSSNSGFMTCATPDVTRLLAENEPLPYVSAQLGHSKPTTTLTYYAHWLPRGNKSFIDRLEAVRMVRRRRSLPGPR